MKKEYVKPNMSVEEIALATMLAASDGSSGTIPGGDTTPGGDGEFTNDRRGGWGDLWN